MGADTRIEWATHTFNPWRERRGTRVVASEAYWRQPLKRARQAREREGSWHADTGIGPIRPRVFCASLADVFEDRPELVGPRARLLDLIHRTPELDWLLLTKRPENIERLWDEAATEWGEPGTLALPMSNVWLGTSIACQEDADRNIPLLLQVPAAVRFVSAEPLIGAVDLRPFFEWTDIDGARVNRGPHWVIIGGESGPRARPMHPGWAVSLIEQCAAASVPCFFKQAGAVLARQYGMRHSKGGDMSEWPPTWRVREVPR